MQNMRPNAHYTTKSRQNFLKKLKSYQPKDSTRHHNSVIRFAGLHKKAMPERKWVFISDFPGITLKDSIDSVLNQLNT